MRFKIKLIVIVQSEELESSQITRRGERELLGDVAKPGKFEDILREQLWHGVSVTTTWALQSSKGPASPKRPGAGTNHDLCKYFFFFLD